MIESNIEPIRIFIKYDDIFPFKMLNKGRKNIELVFSNKDVGKAIIQKYNLKNVRYAGVQKSLAYYIGFSKQHTDKGIVDQFNAIYKKMHKKGKVQRILDKYHMNAIELK